LIHNLRGSSEEEAIEILRRLRHGTDPHSLSQNVQAGRMLAQVSRPGSEGKTFSISCRDGVYILYRFSLHNRQTRPRRPDTGMDRRSCLPSSRSLVRMKLEKSFADSS
jgi:hypothetical protein